jgi:microcystin-dependent protein
MSQTTIPLQFERYLQNQINDGHGPNMNEMIFAYIPGLDLGVEIDRASGLPDVSTWVHQQDVDQVGKLGENALAYSVVIQGNIPAFTFNAIYLHDKNVTSSCGVIVHKIDETKENGMSSTKSLLQAYSGAAQITGITIDAATWQIDYQARLIGIDEEHRLACFDNYGHTAFINGFVVNQEADPTKYKISAGLAYIGGLRAVIDDDVIQTINTKPNTIYVDVFRDGSALSKHINNAILFTATSATSDYIDENSKQHYVAKVASINADGSITQISSDADDVFERADNAANNSDIDEESNAEKHIKMSQYWRGIDKKIAVLTLQIEKERVSIGEIIEITGNEANPATLKGYGTWLSFGSGLVTVGVGSHTDSRGETKAWVVGQTEGEYKHAQTESEMAQHDHTDNFSATTGNDTHSHTGNLGENRDTSSPVSSPSQSNFADDGLDYTTRTDTHNHSVSISGGVLNAGSGTAANNTQPTIAVYRWKRTA